MSGERGLLVAIGCFYASAFAIFLEAGCGANTVPAVVGSIETAICILNVASKDEAQHLPAGTVVADCIQQCATDAATVAQVLDAHHAAAAREANFCGDGGP